jgi:hypothetical protein
MEENVKEALKRIETKRNVVNADFLYYGVPSYILWRRKQFGTLTKIPSGPSGCSQCPERKEISEKYSFAGILQVCP